MRGRSDSRTRPAEMPGHFAPRLVRAEGYFLFLNVLTNDISHYSSIEKIVQTYTIEVMKKIALGIFLVALVAYGAFYIHRAQAYTLAELVEVFIAEGIIPMSEAERARAAVNALLQGGENAEHVDIQASQLIQYGTRTYKEGEEVRGLVLNVGNTSDHQITLTGRRKCVLSYKIMDNEKVLYDSAEHEPCTSGEAITYELGVGKTRILEVRHSPEAYTLSPGTYTILMEYPGYGSGSKEVTIEGGE